MPFCQKCNVFFPNWIKILGETKNLSNRKYCLDCSPWGAHNTRKLVAGAPTYRKFKYDWGSIQEYYNLGNTLKECQKHFGFSNTAFTKARARGVLKLRSPEEATALASFKGRKKVSIKNKVFFSEIAKRTGLGGIPRKKCFHNGMRMDSSYEVRMAKLLDTKQIRWVRPAPDYKSLPWIDEAGVSHVYYADFYLLDYDIYLDPKNSYLIKLHANKIKAVTTQNNVSVKIIPLSLIQKWEKNGFDIKDFAGCDISDFELTTDQN